MDVRMPDGTIIKNVPEGTTKADLAAKLQRNGMAVPSEWLAASPPPVAPQNGTNNNLGAQIGLTARAGIKGLAGLAGIGADAIGGIANTAQNVIAGRPGAGFQFKPTASTIDDLLDKVGLPKPSTPMERVAAEGTEMMSGAGGAAKLAQKGADLFAKRAAPVANSVFTRLAADPTSQVVGAGAGGVSGQQAKESGAGGLGQFVSAMGGGIAGAGAVAGAKSAAAGIKSMIPQQQQIALQRVDQVINVSLQSNGIDPASVTPAMRASLREQVSKAMKLGQLNEDAVARLSDYTRLNMTPTRGRLTLDPYDVTQEMNASKMAAATGQRDALLPAIAQNNNKAMLGAMDGFNPVSDPFATGQRAMAPIQAMDRAQEASKKAAYRAADGMAGGEIPLQRGPLNDVYGKLTAARKLRFLPEQVMGTIDDILNDVRAPFTVNELDSLKTTIATAQRGTQDGNVKAALKIVRDHLDAMPLTPEKKTFGGNQVVTEQGANFLRNQDAQAGNVKGALDEARGLNFNWMRWRESTPGIEAAVNDANPETFVRNFIRSNNADLRHVADTATVINRSPDAREAVRSELVQYLKDAAIGKGNRSDTGNFSGRGWMSALDSVGARKLGLFFDADEIERLRSIGRVGTIETFQPRGSAVNNSNTAAGVAGLLQGLSKYVKPLANKLPLGQEIISNPLQSVTLSMMQRPARNIPAGLLSPQMTPQGSIVDPLLMPALLGGSGLLSSQ